MNVFLGLGLPWVIATAWKGEDYYVPGGALGFSVAVFITVAIICLLVLVGRRKFIGGELGGTNPGRAIFCAGLVGLWIIYIVLSILQAYGLLGDSTFGISD